MVFISGPRPRLRFLVIALAVALAIFVTVSRLGWGLHRGYTSKHHLYVSGINSDDLARQVDFWKRFSSVLRAHAPTCASPTRLTDAKLDIGFAAQERARPDLLVMPHDYVDLMREAHTGFVADIKFMHHASHQSLQLPYKPGTRGIVSTAGASYLVVFVISLRMLRRTGSTLPVEVFLANLAEYETHICHVVLPTLNAKCIVLAEILDAVPAAVEISRYQYKILAILFSSFDDLLFLDSDAFPVHDPDVLFASEPFNSTGLVLWPDFWYPSESPAYFDISSQPMPPLSARQSTESGEILYSKATHTLPLLLATYYNLYGPAHYYPLQSQGAPGEGDKETYGWAATALGMPVYYVREPVAAIGIVNPESGLLEGSAMVQYDPRDDYITTPPNMSADSFGKVATPFFVHANFPKFNPATIWTDPGPTRNPDGSFRRVWEAGKTMDGFAVDIERRFWEEIRWAACTLETTLESWTGMDGICDIATDYWSSLFGLP